MLFDKGDKIVFIGDSITDCNRARPIGEGRFDQLGYGYVSLVHAMLQCRYPDTQIRVVNMGVNGNTVRDLKARWKSDVIDLHPDWVSIMIGVNDVWRQLDSPQMKETHVYLDEYEETLSELVMSTSPYVKGIILMTPFFIESNRDDTMRRMVDTYRSVVKKIAHAQGTVFIDVQSEFDRLLDFKYSAELAWDRVHPSLVGHMAIADAVMKAVEQEGI